LVVDPGTSLDEREAGRTPDWGKDPFVFDGLNDRGDDDDGTEREEADGPILAVR
jgi:hypothetical protein